MTRHNEWFQIENAYGTKLNLNQRIARAINIDGLMMPVVRNRIQTTPFQHGASWLTMVAEPRDIIFDFLSRHCDRQALWLFRDEFSRIINPWLGPFTFRAFLPGNRIRELREVVYDGGLDVQFGTIHDRPQQARTAVRLLAYDPIWWGDEHAETQASGIATGIAFQFPLNDGDADEDDFDTVELGGGGSLTSKTFSITYDGSWPAYPVVQLLGPMADPILTNVSTGEKLELDGYTIAAGETVEFDCRFGFKTIESSSAGNIIGYLTTDSDLVTFHLEIDPVVSGGVNAFSFSSGSTTADSRLTIRWEDRYVAI